MKHANKKPRHARGDVQRGSNVPILLRQARVDVMRTRRLTSIAQVVHDVMITVMDYGTGISRISNATLCSRTGRSRRSIQRARRELEIAGLIVAKKFRRGGSTARIGLATQWCLQASYSLMHRMLPRLPANILMRIGILSPPDKGAKSGLLSIVRDKKKKSREQKEPELWSWMDPQDSQRELDRLWDAREARRKATNPAYVPEYA